MRERHHTVTMEWTDDQILEAFKKPHKREQAFNQLVSIYSKRIYWHVRRMVQEHEDANDITQDIFIKIWNNLGEFRGEAGLYSWLYRITANETLSFLRKQQRRPSKELEFSVEPALSAEQALSANSNSTTILRHLEAAIAMLPEKQRQVFIMRYYDALKYEEMEAILGTSIGALKANYHHAVKKIENYLRDL